MYEALLEADVRAALPSVQAPCLVIYAANGSMFEQQGRYLAEHLPKARLVALDGIDHFPWFAGHDRIVAEVEEFLTGARSVVANDPILATLLFIDIVGSTERAAEERRTAFAHLREARGEWACRAGEERARSFGCWLLDC